MEVILTSSSEKIGMLKFTILTTTKHHVVQHSKLLTVWNLKYKCGCGASIRNTSASVWYHAMPTLNLPDVGVKA